MRLLNILGALVLLGLAITTPKLTAKSGEHSEIAVTVFTDVRSCASCRQMAPELVKVKQAIRDSGIQYREYTLHPALVQKYNLIGIPTVIISKSGREIKRFVGFTSASQILKYLPTQANIDASSNMMGLLKNNIKSRYVFPRDSCGQLNPPIVQEYYEYEQVSKPKYRTKYVSKHKRRHAVHKPHKKAYVAAKTKAKKKVSKGRSHKEYKQEPRYKSFKAQTSGDVSFTPKQELTPVAAAITSVGEWLGKAIMAVVNAIKAVVQYVVHQVRGDYVSYSTAPLVLSLGTIVPSASERYDKCIEECYRQHLDVPPDDKKEYLERTMACLDKCDDEWESRNERTTTKQHT